MSAESAILVRSWPVGERTATITVPRIQRTVLPVIEWHPNKPKSLTAEELAQYRHGRNMAMADLARELGGNAVVLEV